MMNKIVIVFIIIFSAMISGCGHLDFPAGEAYFANDTHHHHNHHHHHETNIDENKY